MRKKLLMLLLVPLIFLVYIPAVYSAEPTVEEVREAAFQALEESEKKE